MVGVIFGMDCDRMYAELSSSCQYPDCDFSSVC
jgi:hypothetical protein